MKTHELKINDHYFKKVASGEKPFEIRKDDRGFQVGDVLLLREIEATHSGTNELYTGRKKAVEVTYITDYEQKDGYVVMGISLI